MPTVPTYDRPQVQDQPMSGAKFSAEAPLEAFGGGRGLREVSSSVDELTKQAMLIARQEKIKQDQVVTLEGEKNLSDQETLLLYGSGQAQGPDGALGPPSGALNTKGKSAFGITDQSVKSFSDSISKIAEPMNQDQRVSFTRMAQSRLGDLQKKLLVHESTQRSAYDSELTEGYISSERNAAVQNATDLERVEKAVQRQTGSLTDYANRNNLGEDWAAQKIFDTRSQTRTEVIDRLLSQGQDMQAKVYFDQHKSEFNAKDILSLDKNLRLGSLRGEGQRQADELIASSQNESEALAKARAITEGHPELSDLRTEVTSQITGHYNLNEQAMHHDFEERYRQASAIVEQSNGWGQVPPDLLNSLSPQGQVALKSRIKQLRSGEDITTNWSKYYALLQQSYTPETRAKFLRMNLAQEARGYLGNTEFKELAHLQSGLRSGSAEAEKLLKGIRSDAQITHDTMVGKIDPNSEEGASFRRQVELQVINQQTQTGKPATPMDVQAIADREITKTITSSWLPSFLTGTTRVYQTPRGATPALKIDVRDIPPSERYKIEQALRARREVPTDDRVQDIYQRMINAQHQ